MSKQAYHRHKPKSYQVYNLHNGVTEYEAVSLEDAYNYIDELSDETGWDEYDNLGVREVC